MDKVTRDSCTGYYSCKILKDGEHSFTVYHCLKVAGKSQIILSQENFQNVCMCVCVCVHASCVC